MKLIEIKNLKRSCHLLQSVVIYSYSIFKFDNQTEIIGH